MLVERRGAFIKNSLPEQGCEIQSISCPTGSFAIREFRAFEICQVAQSTGNLIEAFELSPNDPERLTGAGVPGLVSAVNLVYSTTKIAQPFAKEWCPGQDSNLGPID